MLPVSNASGSGAGVRSRAVSACLSAASSALKIGEIFHRDDFSRDIGSGRSAARVGMSLLAGLHALDLRDLLGARLQRRRNIQADSRRSRFLVRGRGQGRIEGFQCYGDSLFRWQ